MSKTKEALQELVIALEDLQYALQLMHLPSNATVLKADTITVENCWFTTN